MKKILTLLFIFLFSCFAFHTSAQQSVIYVDASANGADDGSSWDNAYTDLQDALFNISSTDTDTILVAQGTYKPDAASGSSSATFLIGSDLVMVGGFPTGGGVRDPLANPTILSGDLNGDDVEDDFINFKSDNVNTIMTIASLATDTNIIDGFTIRGGFADGDGLIGNNGGGIYSNGAPTIKNCIFEQNYATINGGSIFQKDNTSSPLVLDTCTFKNNSANKGMGAYLLNGSFDFNNCILKDNVSHGDLPNGSAIYILKPWDGTISDCIFQDNLTNVGPGMVIWQNDNTPTSIDILDCTFTGNNVLVEFNTTNAAGLTLVSGGDFASFTVKGCTFSDNNSMGRGGGLAVLTNPGAQYTNLLIDSCLFENNQASYNGSALYALISGQDQQVEVKRSQFLYNTTLPLVNGAGAIDIFATGGATGTATVDDCYFEGNIGGADGALELGNLHGGGAFMDFFVRNSVFRSNQANGGGAIRITSNEDSQTDAVIEDCEFYDNISSEEGGAINITSVDASVKIDRCIFDNNESPKGSAVHIKRRETGNVQVVIENSLVTNNIGDGASIFVDSSAFLSLINSTVADNPNNGIEVANEGALQLHNTILHNNGTTNFAELTDDVTITSGGGNLFGDDSFEDYIGDWDVLNADPLFLGSGEYCEYFQLSENSPAVNRGQEWTDAPETDLCGNDRIQENRIDAGAFESPFVNSVREVISNELIISPNPASEMLTIKFHESVQWPVDASLFDAQGKLVKRQTVSNGQAIILNDLENGMYLIKIDLFDKVIVGRFVKQ